ncbi:hypothetical protein CQW23_19228, partial [Capsicum baccatum]
LMLLGFISLLLTVSQDRILKICISKNLTNHWLPCKKDNDAKETVHFLINFFSLVLGGRCLLVGSANSGYYGAKDKAPLLSLTALHHLHTFIFVLAVSHVTLSALTILFGGLKIRQWKSWEEYNPEEAFFVKQFFGSVTKLDYTTLRLGFIMIHCKGNPKFNFHKYMIRVLEADFKKVVRIRRRLLQSLVGHRLWHRWRLCYGILDSETKGFCIGGAYAMALLDQRLWHRRRLCYGILESEAKGHSIGLALFIA